MTSSLRSFVRTSLALACFTSLGQALHAQTVTASGNLNKYPDPNPSPSWGTGSELYVGYNPYSSGEIAVRGGGTVSGSYLYVGYNTGTTGWLSLSGVGSTWTVNSPGVAAIGHYGDGEALIEKGAKLYGMGRIGGHFGSTGRVAVTGTGSAWEGSLFIGHNGTGSLQIQNNASATGALGTIGFFGHGSVVVTGPGSIWSVIDELHIGSSINGFATDNPAPTAEGAVGTLNIRNGGTVISGDVTDPWYMHSARIGFAIGSQGSVTINGAGSGWENRRNFSMAQYGNAVLTIENGGTFSNALSSWVGVDGTATVRVSGSGSQWTNTGDVILGGSSLTESGTGSGSLTLEGGGKVTIGGSLKNWSGSLINLEITGDNLLQVTGDLINDGRMRLNSTPGLASGTYTPVAVTGEWTGTGSYEAVGGIWDRDTGEFTVGDAETTTAGNEVTFDLATTQRLEVAGTGGGAVALAFNANAVAIGGGSTISVTATENPVNEISGREVYSAWNFSTDLASGTEVLLSLEVGSEWNSPVFMIWHSDDGEIWTRYQTEVSYEGGKVHFYVDGFSSYAVTQAVPEPSTLGLLFLTACSVAGWRFRRSERHQRVGIASRR